ncbi:uncharacterized protein APUU_40504A [Aspergillus puulaauensis]|uniref:Aminoglycoside phosphotransferase domain-containing protein n=1 Tax=Aspergillus puulaauensis TaxID=1220207 RepID=A0A7R7XMB9_9EURO|nr:uncharacterized protein APUU_40504A [Aspergillus puulaauensis]BCS24060.1 hypothetical protein APUU_40504A [Aspergillus puulaauensis]
MHHPRSAILYTDLTTSFFPLIFDTGLRWLAKIPTGGRLLFGEDGRPSGIGPMRKVDKRAMLERWFIHQDPDNDPIHIECAASSNQKTCYTPMLDKYPEQDLLSKGLAILLRQLIDWIPEPENMDPFAIAHPDFDIQKFIVSEEGELKGIIDWDGVTAVPRTIGNERYPGWLTRDWDPGMYGYTEEMKQNGESESVWEASPKSLAYYRGIYDAAMMKRLVEREGSESRVNLCRMSLITENLAIAADDSACRSPILEKVVSEIYTVTGQDDPLDFIEVANMFIDGNMDGAVMDTLYRGFIEGGSIVRLPWNTMQDVQLRRVQQL